MAGLFAYGLLTAISIAIGIILTIISLFVGHIILFDSIILALASGVVCNQLWSVHPALCLLIGIAVFALLFWLQRTKAGFWIIGLLMSAAWAFVFSVFAHIFSNGDMVWTYVILGLGFVLMVGLHLKVKDA